MTSWETVTEIYKQYRDSERFSVLIVDMLKLTDLLSNNFVQNISARVSISANFTLLLSRPGSDQSVHISWVGPGEYEVFYDYAGAEPEEFYSDGVKSDLRNIVFIVKTYLTSLDR